MWQDRWTDEAVPVGRSFNNNRVFETVELADPENAGRTITYTPLPEYLRSRFIPHIASLGPRTVDEQLRGPLLGQAHDFSRETRALALLTGLRETGLPLMPGHFPRGVERYERIGGRVYLRNFAGSGLDHIDEGNAPREVLRHLEGSAARHHPLATDRRRQHLFDTRVIRDDPDSTDPRDVLINQQWMLTIFNAYLQYRQDEALARMDLDSMNRPVRLFWRALSFGGQNGCAWRSSSSGAPGVDTLKNLMDLLSLDYSEVPALWNERRVQTQVDQINDQAREELASLARRPDNTGSSESIRANIPTQIHSGLRHVRYFQAIKMAAITEGFLICMDQGVFQATHP